MPKRSKEEKEERIRRKIRKLQYKLDFRSGSESPEASPCAQSLTGFEPLEPVEPEDVHENDPQDVGEDLGSVTDLDENILTALGSTQVTERVYGDDVHKEIVKRIEGIIVNGIKKESLEEIIQKYNIPKNASLLDAPKLNLELQGLLNEQIKARDKRLEDRQQLIGLSIAAILQIIDKLVSGKENNPLKSIAVLTDVSRLLAEIHFQETAIRRKLIGPSLDMKIAKSLENVKRDCHLFENFSENIKTANAIKKSATTILKPSGQIKKSKKENFRGPPRTNQYQFNRQGRGGGKNQQRGFQRFSNQTFQPRQQPQPQKNYQRKRYVPQT